MTRALLLFKPDAVAHGIVEETLADVRAGGLRVLSRHALKLTESQLARFYFQICPDERPLTAGLLRRYLVDNPSELVVIEGPDVLARLHRYKAAIRSRCGDFIYGNYVHSADTRDEAERQIAVLNETGGPGAFRPVAPYWNGWTMQACEQALDEMWADVRVRVSYPACWSPWPRSPGLVLTAPARLVVAFDEVVLFLARSLQIDDPGTAVRATLAALYDPMGLSTAVTGPRAEILASSASEFGLLITDAAFD